MRDDLAENNSNRSSYRTGLREYVAARGRNPVATRGRHRAHADDQRFDIVDRFQRRAHCLRGGGRTAPGIHINHHACGSLVAQGLPGGLDHGEVASARFGQDWEIHRGPDRRPPTLPIHDGSLDRDHGDVPGRSSWARQQQRFPRLIPGLQPRRTLR